MKRHIALQPLSRQHHTGLLAVLLLKKGIARQASAAVMWSFLQQCWKNDLLPHFAAEEEILLPAVLHASTERVTHQILTEHAQIREKYAGMEEQGPSLAALEEFIILLEQHIRLEERQYFPALEAFIPPGLAGKLADLEGEQGAHCLLFEPRFWE